MCGECKVRFRIPLKHVKKYRIKKKHCLKKKCKKKKKKKEKEKAWVGIEPTTMRIVIVFQYFWNV